MSTLVSGSLARHELSATVKVLGRQSKIKCKFDISGEVGGYIQAGNVISLPNISDDIEITQESLMAKRGFADHEAFHARFSDLDLIFKFNEYAHKCGDGLSPSLFNALEDMYIEKMGLNFYAGCYRSLSAAAAACYQSSDGTLKFKPVLSEPLLITKIGRRLMRTGCEGDNCNIDLINNDFPELVSIMEKFAAEAILCKSTQDVLELTAQYSESVLGCNTARNFLNGVGPEALNKGGSNEENNTGYEASEGDSSQVKDVSEQAEDQDRSEQSSNNGNRQNPKTKRQLKRDADADTEKEKIESNENDSTDTQDESNINDEPYSSGAEGIPTCGDTMDGDTMGSESLQRKAFKNSLSDKCDKADLSDVWNDIKGRSSNNSIMDLGHEKFTYKAVSNDTDWPSIKPRVKGLHVFKSTMIDLLTSDTPRFWGDGFKSGRLNSKQLVRAYNKYENVYLKKSQGRDNKTAISLMIDVSNSMGDNNGAVSAALASEALAEAFTMLGVDFEIIGWTESFQHEDFILGDGMNLDVSRSSNHKGLFSNVFKVKQGDESSNNIKIKGEYVEVEFKAFNQVVAPSKIGQLVSSCHLGGTPTMTAIQAATDRLHYVNADRRIVILLTDGIPYTVGGTFNLDDAIAEIDRLINRAKSMDIEVLPIGINSDEIRSYFGKDTPVFYGTELAGALIKELTSKMRIKV